SSTRTPVATGAIAASSWPTSLKSAVSSSTSSNAPTSAITPAPTRIPARSCVPGRNTQTAAATATRIASPPSRGVGYWWRPGWCGPLRDAFALEPERKRHEPPELAAEVLAAGDMAVEEGGHGPGVEVSLAPHPLLGEDLARERLELSAQPRGRGDREAALAA